MIPSETSQRGRQPSNARGNPVRRLPHLPLRVESRPRRRRQNVTTAILAALLCAGCSTAHQTPQATSPWAAEVSAAALRASSDFERQVLGDGEITRAEYEEANQRYVACAKAEGVDIDLIDNDGFYTYSVRVSEQGDQVQMRCAIGTVRIIAGLYEDVQQNPLKQDPDELTIQCLVRIGLEQPGYSLEDYEADRDAIYGKGRGSSSPGELTPKENRFLDCVSNPLHATG